MDDLIWTYGAMGIITMWSKVGMALNIDASSGDLIVIVPIVPYILSYTFYREM